MQKSRYQSRKHLVSKKSLGISLENIWSQKSLGIGLKNYLVSKKSLGLENFGLDIGLDEFFWSHHSVVSMKRNWLIHDNTGRYWLEFGGAWSVWSSTDWYLVVLGQYNLELLGIK